MILPSANLNLLQANAGRSVALRCACDFEDVRRASVAVREFLVGEGVGGEEAAGLELALVEALNNAVEHTDGRATDMPIEVEAHVMADGVVLRVCDHTPGFEWPEQAELPDETSESGRGLFLIQALTDRVEYFRGKGTNLLTMRKACPVRVAAIPLTQESLRSENAELEETLTGMTEELSSNYETLTSIFRYSSELASARSLPEFASELVQDLARMTCADGVVLRLLDEQSGMLHGYPPSESGIGSEPVALDNRDSIEAASASSLEDRWFDPSGPLAETDPLRMSGKFQIGVSHALVLNERLLGTITLGRRGGEYAFRSREISVMHTLGDFLAFQVASERLQEERMKTRVVRRELEIAASIQRSMLPAKLPVATPYSLAASCVSAREVGGDFYDAIAVGEVGVLLVIADVMGKGIPAALLGAILRSGIHSMPQYFDQPAMLLSAVNRVLYDDFSRVDMFATVALGYLDLKERRLCVANAGHPPVLVASPGANVHTALASSGPPIGVLPAVEFHPDWVKLPAGSRALFHTDGLTELSNFEGQMFGEGGLGTWLQGARGVQAEASDLAASLAGRLGSFRGATPARDDQTFVLIADSLHTP